ncbi:MAG: outer membrane beta-barrel protein, partial [Chitinophagaceae bacterium]|nr:outer membrane beta-barrel protein [Chitinophagaceae bacterium]
CYANAQSGPATVTGNVTDSSGKPLAYATISVLRKGQTEPIKKTYSSDKGNFKMLVDTGRYTLVLSHTGFADISVDLAVKPGENIVNGLVMYMSANQLQTVTVVSRKPLVEQTDDKIIYNAENDPASKTESASDILRKTPLVTVDGDGNVQVNGQSNFKILLNGRETAMFANNLKDALKNFPGALIVKVEVITSPSAKYDAEGVGGVINIITKKKVVGYNGYLSSYVSTLGNYSESLSLNVKSGKLGFTAYAGASGPFHPIAGSSITETTPLVSSVFTKRTLTGSRLSKNTFVFTNLELSYEIDSLNTITTYGSVGDFHSHNGLDQSIITDFSAQPSSLSLFTQDNTYSSPSDGIGADFIRKYRNSPEKELDIRFNSQFSKNNGFTNSFQDNPGQDRYVSNTSQSKNREYTFQIDLIEPLLPKLKLESGVKSIMRNAESDFESLLKYNAGDPYIANANNTDNFDYHQEVYSGYGSVNWSTGKYNFRAGLRAEHTNVHGNFSGSKTVVDQHYTNLIPNMLISAKISSSYTISLSYNMRLQRPYITNLNPFVNNNDSLNISYGNPALGPQVLHAVSLQNRLVKGKFFGAFSINASYTNNMISQFAAFNKATGVTATTSDNIGEEFQINAGLNMNATIGEKLSVGFSPLIRYNHIRNKRDPSINRDGISGNAFTNFSYRVTPKFTISGSGGFFHAPFSLVSTQNTSVFYQVNFGYKFFNNKLATTINFNNMLRRDMVYHYVTLNPDLKVVNTSINPYRVIYLGVTYNFGKLKENVSKKKGVNNDDLVQ